MELRNSRILVVGDVILDTYVRTRPLGLSAETPTIVGELEREDHYVGGAGLVVRHLLRLGCRVDLLTSGPIGGKARLYKEFSESSDPLPEKEFDRLNISYITSAERVFTEKRRYYVGPYKAFQVDVLNKKLYYSSGESKSIGDKYALLRTDVDAVVVCDNRHGAIDLSLQDMIVKKHAQYGGKVFVDSQVSQSESNHMFYSGVTAFFLNRRELDAVVGSYRDTEERRVLEASRRLRSGIVLKRGADGSLVAMKDRSIEVHDAYPVNVVDTCGAGDAFLAAYAATEDLEFCNRWAALSTTYVGTVVPKEVP